MSKFKKPPILVSGMLISILGVSGQAYAALASDVVIDFQAADDTGDPMPSAVFPAFGNVYLEDGVEHTAIGFGTSQEIQLMLLLAAQVTCTAVEAEFHN